MIQRKEKKSVIVSEGAFHLSELARQTIPVVTFNKKFQSNPEWYAQRRWVFSKNAWKKRISFSK